MSSQNNNAQAIKHRSNQILLALFSVLFVAIVTYGYYHLLRDFGWFLAIFFAAVVSAFAWFLARVSGSSDDGSRVNWFLVIPLFLVSAAGVYNSMMVFLEGGQVLTDAASDSQQQFGVLESAAKKQLTASGVSSQVAKVHTLRDALFSEIENPLNCGQGPEARRLINELRRELPGFEPLSSPGRNCTQNKADIAAYEKRNDDQVARAPWNNAAISGVAAEAARARGELADLRGEISKSYAPSDLQQVSGIFEDYQNQYQDLRYKLSQEANVDGVPEALPVVAAQSLGNIYKLPALIFSRLHEISTYVYFILAFGFDMLLVYLFQLTARSPLAGAW